MRLAIDTSTNRAIIALEDEGKITERIFEPRATQKIIFSVLSEILDPDTIGELEGIVVGLGPGS
ncbi:MAG: tRNA (adenosine(37)-N6)-threonylcarbamoyltransferase complex dimerization subunit type 1 TsaB, partial [bacterium]